MADEEFERCTKELKDQDLSTPAGRRRANRKAGECSAEVACKVMTKGAMPPGICGPIGDKVAEWVGDAFEAIFAGEDEERKRREEWRKRVAEMTRMLDETRVYDILMRVELWTTQAAMIKAWDLGVPGEKGRLGGGTLIKASKNQMDSNGVPMFPQNIEFEAYSNMFPAGQVLYDLGADIELVTLGDGSKVWQPPDVTLGFQPEKMADARAYFRDLQDSFYPAWSKGFQKAKAKAQEFVTTGGSVRQAQIISLAYERELNEAAAIGKSRSNVLNLALVGLGLAALGTALYTARKR